MLDLMPARGLIIHGWKKHGVCAGQSASAYFEMVRRARAVVKIPPQYLEPQSALDVTPDQVEDAFVAANPGMSRAGVAVTCGDTRLSEVRICMTRDLQFRECADVDRRACRRDKLVMPPVRGS
jgi:ribonuclease T2